MRFFTVLVAFVGAAWVGGLAYRDASPSMALLAGVLVLVAVLILLAGRRKKRREREAAQAAADAAWATAAMPARMAVDALAIPAPAESVAAPVQPVTHDVAPSPGTASLKPDTDDEAAERLITVELEAGPDAVPEPASEDVEADGRASTSIPVVRTPFSVQPAVVLMSLYDAVAERYETRCTHLWLEDAPTTTLRLVAAFGPRVPKGDPVPMSDPILGACASTRTAVFAELGADPAHAGEPVGWRYAVPIGTPEVRGVAGIDLVPTDHDGAAHVLNEVSAILRGSLTASLAVHVARSEMDAAVLLLKAAQELTSGIKGDEILTSALDRAMQLAGASTGSVMLPQGPGGALHIVASRGLSDDIVENSSVESGEGIAGTVFSTSSPLLVEDLPGRVGERRHGVQSSVSIPIMDDKGTLGVMNVGARAFPARLTDAYVRALGLLGSQTAVAMRNVSAAERSWETYLENLQALATALESDDPYRQGASRRIAALTVALGQEMGLGGDEIVSLRIAAILHDVGMGLATGSVGSTDRPLSTVDRGLVRSHPKVASDVMQQVPSLEPLAPLVRHHHERFDGDGYDTGLAGSSIPLGSRILAITDAFVAMTSARPYRDALGPEAALDELNNGSGAQFDPAVVESFISLLAKRPDLASGV